MPDAGPIDASHWEGRLADLAQRHRVPGAQLGILRHVPGGKDDLVVASHGVLNVVTQQPVIHDSIFQIGSITKVWTATVVLQLVDEGLVDLETPIAEVLPQFQLADPEVTKLVTVRHLLNHTSGIDGDLIADTGRGDDCLDRYVELLADQAQNHPLGATWSYCNAGFVVLGRVIEELTALTWDEALRTRLFAPLGLRHAVTLQEDALLQSAAVGHFTEEGRKAIAPVWQLPRSLGPAGLVTASAADMLAFARLHLAGGLGPGGRRILSAESAAAMAGHEVDLPDQLSLGDSWGLGWIRFGWGGQRIFGHDGKTIGQAAFLRIFPSSNLAVTLLTNDDGGRDLYEELFRELCEDLAHVEMPGPLEPRLQDRDSTTQIAPYLGRYAREGIDIDVFVGDDGPKLRTTITGELAAMVPEPVEEHQLVFLRPGTFLTRAPGAETWMPVTFYELATGERYLHYGVRATPKV